MPTTKNGSRTVIVTQEVQFTYDFGDLAPGLIEVLVRSLQDDENWSIYDFDPEVTVTSVEVK